MGLTDSAPITDLTLIRLRSLPELDAAVFLDTRLRALEAQWKRSFVETGLICVEVEERALWRSLCDPAGVPYLHFEAWVCSAAPYSRRHCFSAMSAIRELAEIPISTLELIPECNLALLQQLPVSVRAQSDVITAAEILPEKDFRAKVRTEFPQELIETRRRLFGKFLESKASIIEEALDIVAELAQKGGTELDTLEDRLWYWAVDFVREHSGEREGVQ